MYNQRRRRALPEWVRHASTYWHFVIVANNATLTAGLGHLWPDRGRAYNAYIIAGCRWLYQGRTENFRISCAREIRSGNLRRREAERTLHRCVCCRPSLRYRSARFEPVQVSHISISISRSQFIRQRKGYMKHKCKIQRWLDRIGQAATNGCPKEHNLI